MNKSYVKEQNNDHRLLSDRTKRSAMRVRSNLEVAVEGKNPLSTITNSHALKKGSVDGLEI